MVTTRTETRHNMGLAPLHVRASAASVAKKVERATRRALGKAKKSVTRHAAKSVKKIREFVKSVSPLAPNQDGLQDVEMCDGVIGGGEDTLLAAEVEDGAEVIENVRSGPWVQTNQHHRVTIEEVEDEDAYRFNDHDIDSDADDDDEESTHTMSDDDDGLNLEDHINEEWEREAAQFGELLIVVYLICC